MKFPRHEALDAHTGFLLRKVSTASFDGFSEMVGAHGLHPMHFGMLTIIAAEEPITQRDLSRRTGIDPSTMVARMDMLAERGLVERARSTADRRSYEIRLSAAGRGLLAELREQGREHGDRFFAPLTPSERRRLHELLAKLAASLDESPGSQCEPGPRC
ncbi:MAG: MarR family transcriptional regulator [Actinomycetota bacterium]|nr:MarR family transcriptional regulator [Actinomycetota bacterium]